MTDSVGTARTGRIPLAAGLPAGLVRVVVGVLWLIEGTVKYRAGFGRADILIIVDGARANPRVPDAFRAFAEQVLARFPDLFGSAVPLLEVALGLALVVGLSSRITALVTLGTLTFYWSSDQLTGQYPVMLGLAALILAWPAAADRFSATALVDRLRTPRSRS